MRAVAVIAALLVGLALTAAVAWNAAEAHYQGCVEAAQALPREHTTLSRQQADLDSEYEREVYKRVQACSRTPD